MSETDLKSPCIKLCEVEDEGKFCKECGRSLEEIAEWPVATSSRKKEIKKNSKKRKERNAS